MQSEVSVSVLDFGDPVSVATINQAIAATANGTVVIPEGQYALDGDILIEQKNSGSGAQGFFTLEAVGVRLTGTGRIIVDSCKRIKIIGLDAPNYDVCWRGCWWSSFEDLRFHKLVMGDNEGAVFSSSSWNRVTGGQSQGVILHQNATSYYNALEWYNHTIRGDASQGFTQPSEYAFEFLGDRNAQMWSYNGGDVSYQTEAIYNIGSANTSADVELTFRSVYFDSLWPSMPERNNIKIRTDDCHHANAHNFSQSITSAFTEPVDMYRADRSLRHTGTSSINLIPNGDFRDILSNWVGNDLPIWSTSGGVVTAKSGGITGTYLNIENSNTENNVCYFRSLPLPVASRVTGCIALRNAEAGTRSIQVGIAGLYTTPQISDSEWTFVTITNNDILPMGSTVNVLTNTIDGTAYNVDVAYVSLTLGSGGNVLAPSVRHRVVDHSFPWTPGSIGAGSSLSRTVTVGDAAVGDFVLLSASVGLGNILASATVTSDTEVEIVLFNSGGTEQTIGASTWNVRIQKKSYL